MEAADYIAYTLFNCSTTIEENTIDADSVLKMAPHAKWVMADEVDLHPLISRIIFPHLVNGVDKNDLGVLVSDTLHSSILLYERARSRRIGIIGPIQRTEINGLLVDYSAVESLIHKQRREMIAREELLTEYRGIDRTLRNIAQRVSFLAAELQAAFSRLNGALSQIGNTPLLCDTEISDLARALNQIETVLGKSGFRTYGTHLEQANALSGRIVSRHLHQTVKAAVIRELPPLRVG